MFERGNRNEQARLKELDDNLRIEQSLLIMYTKRLVTFSDDEKEAELAIQAIKDELAEKFRELVAAPVQIEAIKRNIRRYTNERDMLTGKVTGHTKLIKKMQKMKADMAQMEKELAEMQAK